MAIVTGMVVACVLLAPGEARSNTLLRLTTADFLLGDAESPPPAGESWEPVSLPDSWTGSRPGTSGVGWYRLRLPRLETADTPYAIYLPEFNMNAEVWVNGERLARCGRFEAPVAHCWNHPLLVPLPGGYFASGESTVHVKLFTYPAYGGLGALLAGPERILRRSYEWDRFLRVGVARLFTATAAIVVAFMLVFWIGSRESVYGYFALFTAFWAGAMLNNHVRDIPIPHDTWEWLVHTCFDWMGVAAVLTVHRVFGMRRPVMERAVVAWGCAASLIAFAAPREHFHTVVTLLHGVSLALAAWAWSVLFRPGPHATRVHVLAFAITSVVVALGVHDFLIQAGYFGIQEPHLFAFAAPITTVSFSLILTVRFVQTFGRARRLNLELEDRVREKHAELEANFARMGELESARAVAVERERIMREVHDGMGSQLVSTLAMVQARRETPEEVVNALRSCIEDMRLVIDSLDPNVDELPTLLGMIRGRLEPQLRRHGVCFEWRVTDLPPVPRLGPQEFLQILRIFQEAVANVIKHAEARTITVTTGVRPHDGAGEGIFLELRDDGRGLRGMGPRGRGRRNMERRAREFGAVLRVEDAHPGTRVLLWIPIEPAATCSSGEKGASVFA